MSRAEDRRIGVAALRALAHPLRVRLLEQVSARQGATASMLARDVGESSGSTSYHLRQLARHGLIEEDVDRGTAKERWWRPVRGGLTVTGHEFATDPATRDAAQLVVDEFHRNRVARLRHWLDTATEWPAEWVEASATSKSSLRLAPPQLRALVGELFDVIERYRELEPGEGHAAIEVQLHAFPHADGAVPDEEAP